MNKTKTKSRKNTLPIRSENQKNKNKNSSTRQPRLRSSRSSNHWASQLLQNVWPCERDFFERPDRYRYVRKLVPETGCVFCMAEGQEPCFEALLLAKDEHCLIMMNKFPYNTGHLLILPRQHVGNLWELDDTTNLSLATWLKSSLGILKEELGCQGFNLGLNQGAVAGAGLPDHLHWHIVPRWGGDTNFFPLIAETKVLPQTLETTYSRLRPHFEEKALAKTKAKAKA